MKKWAMLICLTSAISLMAEPKILTFAGSTRSDSYNKKLIHAAGAVAKEKGASVTFVDLSDYPMPWYDADLEASAGLPENAKKLRNLMLESNGVIIATPQYNASIPGVLKNAIDWLSRGEDGKPSRAAFQGKKFALFSTSPGKKGAARALAHLHSVIDDCHGDIIEPQYAMPNAGSAFSEEGHLVDQQAKLSIENEVHALIQSLK
jgi:NAD(P)H-dependent FMN reductase